MSFIFSKKSLIFVIISIFYLTSCNNAETIKPSVTPVFTEINIAQTPNPTKIDTQKTVLENQYDVSIDINPVSFLFSGIENITFNNNTDDVINSVYINIPLNAFSEDAKEKPYFDNFENKIYKNGKDSGYINIDNITIFNEDAKYNIDETILEIILPTPIKPKNSAVISIQLSGKVPKIGERTGGNENGMWFGNFLPTLFVYEDGTWKTNNFYKAGDPFYTQVANYNVSITVPKEYTVVGTGLKTVTEHESSKVVVLKSKLVRDFAFSVNKNYKLYNKKTDSGVVINIYYDNDLSQEKINDILNVAEKSLNYYSNLVGEYPYDRLDIVETELFVAGATGYPQIIFTDSEYLKNGESNKLIAHEIGHQWFYNIIGSNQIKTPWLDESIIMLTQESIFLSNEEINKNMLKEYNNLNNNLQNVENTSLTNNLANYNSWLDYYNVQYIKGRQMMYALKNTMGQEVFNEFLKEYFTKFAYKIVSEEEFISLAEEKYGKDLTLFFNNWLGNGQLPDFIDNNK